MNPWKPPIKLLVALAALATVSLSATPLDAVLSYQELESLPNEAVLAELSLLKASQATLEVFLKLLLSVIAAAWLVTLVLVTTSCLREAMQEH